MADLLDEFERFGELDYNAGLEEIDRFYGLDVDMTNGATASANLAETMAVEKATSAGKAYRPPVGGIAQQDELPAPAQDHVMQDQSNSDGDDTSEDETDDGANYVFSSAEGEDPFSQSTFKSLSPATPSTYPNLSLFLRSPRAFSTGPSPGEGMQSSMQKGVGEATSSQFTPGPPSTGSRKHLPAEMRYEEDPNALPPKQTPNPATRLFTGILPGGFTAGSGGFGQWDSIDVEPDTDEENMPLPFGASASILPSMTKDAPDFNRSLRGVDGDEDYNMSESVIPSDDDDDDDDDEDDGDYSHSRPGLKNKFSAQRAPKRRREPSPGTAPQESPASSGLLARPPIKKSKTTQHRKSNSQEPRRGGSGRCLRCRKAKKGCDRERPCGLCSRHGIGLEGCIVDDENSSIPSSPVAVMSRPVSAMPRDKPEGVGGASSASPAVLRHDSAAIVQQDKPEGTPPTSVSSPVADMKMSTTVVLQDQPEEVYGPSNLSPVADMKKPMTVVQKNEFEEICGASSPSPTATMKKSASFVQKEKPEEVGGTSVPYPAAMKNESTAILQKSEPQEVYGASSSSPVAVMNKPTAIAQKYKPEEVYGASYPSPAAMMKSTAVVQKDEPADGTGPPYMSLRSSSTSTPRKTNAALKKKVEKKPENKAKVKVEAKDFDADAVDEEGISAENSDETYIEPAKKTKKTKAKAKATRPAKLSLIRRTNFAASEERSPEPSVEPSSSRKKSVRRSKLPAKLQDAGGRGGRQPIAKTDTATIMRGVKKALSPLKTRAKRKADEAGMPNAAGAARKRHSYGK